MSRLRKWWGTSRRSSTAAPNNHQTPSSSPIAVDAPATEDAKKPDQSTESSGRELFLTASNAQEREEVLKNHPFWQTKNIEQQLGVPEVAAVIEHISELHAKYGFLLSSRGSLHSPYGNEGRVQDMRGIQWGTRAVYRQWHQRAVALSEAHPNESGVLLSALQKHIEATARTKDVDWLEEAEDILRLGGSVSTRAMLNGWFIRAQARQFEDLDIDLQACPRMALEFQRIERDAEIVQWVEGHFSGAQLVAMLHPRLDGWTLAEHIPKKDLILSLAEHVKDGALLKAWHGLALTGEETLQHPLAYSLYVHKHAHIYLEEARPLPDAWSMALSLSTTGLEFKEILLSAAHVKMNPEQKPETLMLPALEA